MVSPAKCCQILRLCCRPAVFVGSGLEVAQVRRHVPVEHLLLGTRCRASDLTTLLLCVERSACCAYTEAPILLTLTDLIKERMLSKP